MDLIISILSRALIAGTPLLLATIGEIIAERSGVYNLGIEGLMSLGAVTAFAVTYTLSNPWIGLICAILVTAILSLIHAFVCVTLNGKQTLSGLALTMVGIGISGVLGRGFIGIPLPSRFSGINIPILTNIPILGKIFFNKDPLFYISLILTFISYYLIFKTKVGINLRSVGESPKAADSAGINVKKYQYIAVIIGGSFSGIAGAYLSTAYIPQWIEGMTGGRGWIVIALTIFAYWDPIKALWGAYLFGGIYVLQYLLQPLGIPPSLLLMLPYLCTLLVLILTASKSKIKHIGPPASLGEPFIKEEK
ncbi:MAG: ABC transporter permease [Spirochaetales bacterium]|nr:ABC transporter permease [Spirochaetales bacterium]